MCFSLFLYNIILSSIYRRKSIKPKLKARANRVSKRGGSGSWSESVSVSVSESERVNKILRQPPRQKNKVGPEPSITITAKELEEGKKFKELRKSISNINSWMVIGKSNKIAPL